jgi:hypothetical protein
MAAGDKITSAGLTVSFAGTQIGDEGTSFEVTQESQEIDTTTFGDTTKTALPDEPSQNATLTGYNVEGGAPALDSDIGDTGALVWVLAGVTKTVASAVVLSKNENYTVNGLPGFTMTYKLNGDITVGGGA